ncbi:hypothetical protein GTA08_BOTSDO08322 [Botryosphaeria dothidea]|uniref:Uncharacterized protein n=1 Tax=Botryosphaeria dothidea TaxID=55169 RepID=A0A8H4MYI2_9PEZI|nr:hypothetical protein GTA08_BOTSDO08322 [Botryosphaeria dothidea]
MSAMVDSYAPPYGRLPQRKPVPQTGLQPLTQIVPDEHRSAHTRTRTSSSSVFPQMPQPPGSNFTYNPPQYQPAMTQYSTNQTRRTLSNATTSTSSTSTSAGAGNARRNSDLRRSSSGRSTASQSSSSYVALMRRQKATVWCDRSQYEDPRLAAQQRAAKMRAAMEVVGGNQTSRTSTSSSGVAAGVRSKIRHHGAPKASLYTPANLTGSGVPMRLSASEVDEGESDNDSNGVNNLHNRSGSGRSSLNSGRRVYSYAGPSGARNSTGSTPPSGQGNSPTDMMAGETPVQGDFARRQSSYFPQRRDTGLSGGSGSSGERENSFGGLGQMPQHEPQAAEPKKTSDDLRRRGSVDDRTMTMSGAVRLFVANPDNDSD